MNRDTISFRVEGSKVAISDLRGVLRREADQGVRVQEVVTGDPATVLTIVASSLAIVDILVRWNSDRAEADTVTIVMPDGKKVDLKRGQVDSVEKQLRELLELKSTSEDPQ